MLLLLLRLWLSLVPGSSMTYDAIRLPETPSCVRLYLTRSPSFTEPSPCRSWLTWQKTSAPPSDGLMKPKPPSLRQRSSTPVPNHRSPFEVMGRVSHRHQVGTAQAPWCNSHRHRPPPGANAAAGPTPQDGGFEGKATSGA
uniref:Secreted protein n=1 Tax=Pyrodinium bahamense TaxID=73915 RepID=A0A7S0AIR4_9DINO